MATCDPKTLPTQATCFRCVPPGEKRLLELYLLNISVGSMSVPMIAAGSARYRPIHDKMALAAKVYLLAVLAGGATSAQALEAAAKCWQCIPVSERLNVETYLYATIAGGSTDPKQIMPFVGPYRPLYPIRDQVEIYLLNLAAGLSTSSLMAGLACLMCLSTTRLEEIYLYLLCGSNLANLVPSGSHYGPGTAEFDLSVKANTCYQITWGANDLSMTLCGTSFPSTGAGTQIVVCTGACTVMQFFGTFAGTSVTVIVKPVPTPIPTPTGFTLTFNSGTGNSTATWNAPPAGVFSTEVWTSSDNITFTLAQTIATSGTSATILNSPAVGFSLYVKIRFTSKVFPGYSAFTSTLSVAGTVAEVDAWVARVVANGGATPSANTQAAMSTMVNTLKGGTNVWSKILALNVIAPDSLIAALTPLIKGTGNDPWTNHNFVNADLTVNGLVGDGATKYLDTGLIGDASGQTATSAGMGVYVSVDNATGVQSEIGVYGSATNSFSGVDCHYNTTVCDGGLFRFDAGGFVTATSPGSPAGFYSIQRTGATTCNIYFANSVTAHASIGSNGGTPVGAPEHTFSIFVFGNNSVGTPVSFSRKRLSIVFETQGLSAADDSTLYSAFQAVRTAFGGGFV